jgi:hypothetical protein
MEKKINERHALDKKFAKNQQFQSELNQFKMKQMKEIEQKMKEKDKKIKNMKAEKEKVFYFFTSNFSLFFKKEIEGCIRNMELIDKKSNFFSWV